MIEDQDFDQPRQASVITLGGHFGSGLQSRRDSQGNGGGLGFWASPRHVLNVLRFYVLIQYEVMHFGIDRELGPREPLPSVRPQNRDA